MSKLWREHSHNCDMQMCELQEQADNLLKALKRIEWGRASPFEWASSEQLRDMAREAIRTVEPKYAYVPVSHDGEQSTNETN